MKSYVLSFDRNFDRKGKGWRISHKENGSTFSSLVCDLLMSQLAYVSNTRKLQEKLDKGTVPFAAITTVPLYNKSLMDIKKNKDNTETIAVYVEAIKDQEIVDVQLRNCGATFVRVTPDKTKAAFVVYATDKDKWSIMITQSNGQTISVNNTGKITNGKTTKEIVKPERLRLKRVVYLPNNTVYFTRPDKETKAISRIKGAESISIAQALSKNSIIVGDPNFVIFDKDTLNDQDITQLKETLTKIGAAYIEVAKEDYLQQLQVGKKQYKKPAVLEVEATPAEDDGACAPCPNNL